MGPLDVVLNKGFAVAQFYNRDRFIFHYEYAGRHVWRSLTRFPAAVAAGGGWGSFVQREIFPLTLDWREWKWAPNYAGHTLEGGITYRRLAEWNRAHGVPAPRVTAALVTMGSAVVNEMYSHPGRTEGSASTAADLLLFDPLGIVLFTRDDVARFFAEELRATVWSSQAGLTPAGELVNNGNNLILKLPLSPVPGTSLFVRAGLAFTPGITVHRPNGLDVSLGLGVDGRTQGVDPLTGEETPELAAGGGVFIDRHGSLLVSALVSQVSHRRLVVNVYPGVIPGVGRRLGAWVLVREGGSVRLGLSLGGGLGVGPAAAWGPDS